VCVRPGECKGVTSPAGNGGLREMEEVCRVLSAFKLATIEKLGQCNAQKRGRGQGILTGPDAETRVGGECRPCWNGLDVLGMRSRSARDGRVASHTKQAQQPGRRSGLKLVKLQEVTTGTARGPLRQKSYLLDGERNTLLRGIPLRGV